MSYPYETNPWGDDNYGGGSNNQQPPASSQEFGSYSTGQPREAGGYDNPVNQYYYNDQSQNYDQYNWDASNASQHQQQPELANIDPQGLEQASSETTSKPAKDRSAFRRFICVHLPILGSILDTCSSINLPLIDALVQHVNRDLLVSKMFYFFFYSAFGSLFPLMGVYFKQLGMNPSQVGILTGVRPFIEIFSAPFWNNLAERFQKSKALLIFSLFSWIIFTYSLAHIRPPASACIAYNDTDYVLYTPYSENDLRNVDVSQFTDEQQKQEAEREANTIMSGSEINSSKIPEEKKEVLLAGDEAKNEQRRRKKRDTIPPLDLIRFQTTLPEIFDELSKEARDLIDLDLENDFSDRLIGSPRPRMKRTARETDDMLGETDETDDTEAPTATTTERARSSERPTEEDGESGDEMRNEDDNEIEPADQRQQAEQQTASASTSTQTWTTTMEPSRESKSEESSGRTKRIFKQRHKTPPTHIVGMSPITVEYAANYKKEKHGQFVTPMFSTVVYKLEDIKGVFFLLLLLICLGEFFSAPALTLADSATLRYLGENTDLYCRQRMFGSLSWAVTLLLVGMALDNATSISDHPCGPHLRERSYTVCYIIFSLLMGCALLTATQFRFDYPDEVKKSDAQSVVVTKTAGDDKVMTSVAPATGSDDLYASTQPRSIFNTAPPINEPPPSVQQKGGGKELEFLEKWKSAVFAQRTRELPEWVDVFRQFSGNSLHLTYLFITWFLGCGVGLVFTFLFWHLQDVGGTPTLFGICSVINHISEILAYFFSFSFIKRFGHTRVS